MKVRVQISKKRYNSKPKDVGAVKYDTQSGTGEYFTVSEIMRLLSEGYVISPGILVGGQGSIHWREQQIFMLDFDNKYAPIFDINAALKVCKTRGITPAFYYYTYTSTFETPKFRLVFVCGKAITTQGERAAIMQGLISIFPQADRSCINADRIFFGTNNTACAHDLEATFNSDSVIGLFNPPQPVPAKNDNELETLKSTYDFLRYLIQRNGGIKKQNDKYVMFKNCEVCGHKDCLVYYYETNSFYCFGSSGNIGGSIVDYLMRVDKLSLADAIYKFKYDLCGLPPAPHEIANRQQTNSTKQKFDVFTAADLLNTYLPPIHYAVAGLIPQGLTILASPPKYCKSWWVLDLGLCVAAGVPFLNKETTQSGVLYLALEDGKRRLQDRIRKLCGTNPVPRHLSIQTQSNTLETGLLDDLADFISANPNTKLIIIDTLQKIRDGIKKNEGVYGNDYREVGKLQSFAQKHGICIIVVHHTRKGKDETDPFSNISGTNALTGAADAMLVLLKRNRMDSETILSITGREILTEEWIMKFNEETVRWQIIGDTETESTRRKIMEYENNPIVITIRHLLNDADTWKGTATQLQTEAHKLNLYLDSNAATLGRAIRKLEKDLYALDSIGYTSPARNGGNSGRQHQFRRLRASIDAE